MYRGLLLPRPLDDVSRDAARPRKRVIFIQEPGLGQELRHFTAAVVAHGLVIQLQHDPVVVRRVDSVRILDASGQMPQVLFSNVLQVRNNHTKHAAGP